MKKQVLSITLLCAFCFGIISVFSKKTTTSGEGIPNDYLWAQRAFPYQDVPSEAYYDALEWASNQTLSRGGGSLNWTLAGPDNVGGRITDVAMHQSDLQTIYAATASGGVWKSSDTGANWTPITDDLPSLSIGDIAIDPSDKNTLYCGTGETNGGGGSVTYDGRGVFKSTDGGDHWQSLGLEACGSIGRIEVDPQRPNHIFVAAMGRLFGNNPERGLYRSLDAGLSWDKKLFINDSVGVIDLAIHPQNPDTIFAVSWERTRRPNKRVYGGPGSGIWRSIDGGDHWTKLIAGLPDGVSTGRIGIAISASNPAILYATFARTNGSFEGVYKSSDNGDSWSLVPQNANPGYSSYGWWFGQIRVHPSDANHIFNLGITWLESSDGGSFWSVASQGLHVDYHALYIHPANPDLRVVGNDGGIYISVDGGASWQHRPLPITQLYTSEIDFQYPTRFSGGAQDNGTHASANGAVNDWVPIYGGDGFVTLVNPVDHNIYYAELQYGGFFGSNGASAPLATRYNWNTPYIFDPNNPNIMYFGAEKLFRSTNGGLSWLPISADLSNGATGAGGVVYGTITAIAASPITADVLFAGTDDGNVWATVNGGNHWTKVSNSLPKRWVTRLVADRWDANTAYVCLSGFRHDEPIAQLYKTIDAGQTWTSVAGNLPDVPVNDLILDPLDPSVWYIATDAGVFSTINAGSTWMPANTGLPRVPVLDLTFHAPTRTMVAATYGRSMYRTTVPIPLPSATIEPSVMEQLNISPNPFVAECQVSFLLFEDQAIRLDLYDPSGRYVKSIFEGSLDTGKHKLPMSLENLSAGVYYLKAIVSGRIICKKVVKLR